MSYAINSFTVTARSAWSTLNLCDRVARRHYRKSVRAGWIVYNVLSSDEAVRTYCTIYNAFQLAAAFAVWAGMTTRDAIQVWADNLVESSLPQEETIAPVEVVEEEAIVCEEEVVEDASVVSEAVVEEVQLEGMSIRSLRQIASELRISKYSRKSREQLVSEIREVQMA